jgi:ABC-type transport system substrate-binding protein
VDLTGFAARRRALATVVSILAVVSLAASACGSSSSGSATGTTRANSAKNGTNITVANPGAPKHGGTLNFGLNADTNGWSPVLDEWAASAYIVAGAIFDHLAEYDSNYVPRPYLAQSITSNANFTQWTITMRPNVTFQDGEKCDAQAVADNFNAQRHSPLTGPVFQTVTDVKVTGPLTLVLTMNQPWSTFPHTLTTQPGSMAAPKAMLDKDANGGDGGATHPVGTGPFKFVSWVPGGQLVVQRNPHYWRTGYPYLDGIVFKILTDVTVRTQALLAGEENAIESQDPLQISILAKDAQAGKIQFYTDQGLQQMESFQALNVAKAPFDDPLAREIVAYATDRVGLNRAVYGGVFTPAVGPFGPAEKYYTSTDVPTYNPTKARELEAQYVAKHHHPLSFSMIVTPQATVQRTGEFLQQNMSAVGASMSLITDDQVKLIQDVILGQYDSSAFLLFGTPTLDTNYVFISNKTIGQTPGLSLNFTRMNDPVLTQALDAARATDSLTQQIADYKVVQQRFAKNLNFIFWAHDLQSIAYGNNVHGLTGYPLPDGHTGLTQIVPLTFATWMS